MYWGSERVLSKGPWNAAIEQAKKQVSNQVLKCECSTLRTFIPIAKAKKAAKKHN